MFFNWFRNKPRLRYEGTSFGRVIFMIIVFAAMCWAFWANSERYTSKFSAAGRVQDQLGAFSDTQKNEIVKILGRINRNVQVKVHVHTRDGIFTSPEAIDGEVLLGISPNQKQVVIFMPPLWRNAVGDGFIYQLRNEIISPGFEDGTWPDATIKALLLMEYRFESMVR